METTTSETTKHQELKVLEWLRENNLVETTYNFINRKDCYKRYITGIVGWMWEDEFFNTCKAMGYHVCKSDLNSRHDITVNGYKVQCKFSASQKAVDIRNKDKNTNRRYRSCDLNFIALKNNNDIYIIPSSELLSPDLTFLKQTVIIDDISIYQNRYDLLKGKTNEV